MSDAEEIAQFPEFANDGDPSRDNYQYFLQAEGGILERYRFYNGSEGNSPVEVTNTDRGNTPQPDVEDINRDFTMNTVDSYFEYEIDLFPGMGQDNNQFIQDIREVEVTTQTNEVIPVRWCSSGCHQQGRSRV